MRTPPDIEQWRELHRAADQFREASPWEALAEDELVALDSPELGETLYCSILGAQSDQFGMIAARGARGLLGYALLTTGELNEDERSSEQDGLSLLLGNPQLLNDEDRDIHKELGLEYADDSTLPLFLSLRPHYVATRPDASEAEALTIALDQVRALVESMRAGEDLPEPVEGEEALGRRRGDDGAWETAVVNLPAAPEQIRLQAEQVRCAAVLRFGQRSRQVWEVTTATLSAIEVPDEGTSFWARMLLCVDKDSKALVGGVVMGPEENVQNALLSAIEQGGTIPRYLDVSSSLLHSQLEPLADVLKIRMRRVERVPLAEEARRAMKAALP